MNNPFKHVFDAAIERGENKYEAERQAKVVYADHMRILCEVESYSAEFLADQAREYTRLLNEATGERG